MKCFKDNSECRSDCALYQEGYKQCSFYVLPILLAMCVKQLKEATELVESLGYDLLDQRETDDPNWRNVYLGEGTEEK